MILKTTKSLENDYKNLYEKIVEDSLKYDGSLESYSLMEQEWMLFYKIKKALDKRDKKSSHYISYDGKQIYICDYYPIKYKINEELLETLTEQKETYTQEEIDTLLRWTVNNTRDNLVVGTNSTIQNIDVTGTCGLAQYSSIRPLEKLGLKVTYNNIGQFGSLHRHAFGTVTFPVENGTKTYLIDTTYAQFFKLERNVKNFYDLDAGYYMIQNENTKNFAETLLNQGYIEATQQNILKYAYGFIADKENKKTNIDAIQKSESDEMDYTDEEFYQEGLNLDFGYNEKKKL